ncbi:hypothetical protein D3C72_463820 [compost metagenome]|jgi:hypothetical protein
MASRTSEPPQWNWAQLETALEFMGADRSDPLHQYLLDGLQEPEVMASGEAFLRELLSVAALLAARGQDIARRQTTPWSDLPSSSC